MLIDGGNQSFRRVAALLIKLSIVQVPVHPTQNKSHCSEGGEAAPGARTKNKAQANQRGKKIENPVV